MAKSYFEITVEGKGSFPFDMLRHSRCWPVGVEDVENLNRGKKFNVRRTVRVAMIGNSVEAGHCVKRFESYMWTGDITLEERNYS